LLLLHFHDVVVVYAVLQLLLDFLERFSVRFDRVTVSEVCAPQVDGREAPEHDVHAVLVGHKQEHLVGDEREEREGNGGDGGTVRANVHRKHLAQKDHRDEPDTDRIHDGEREVARIRQPRESGCQTGRGRGQEVVQAEDERDRGQTDLGRDQQRLSAHPVHHGQPDEVDRHQHCGEHYDVHGFADNRRWFRKYERRVRDQAANATGPLRCTRRHHHHERLKVLPVGKQLAERRFVLHVFLYVHFHEP